MNERRYEKIKRNEWKKIWKDKKAWMKEDMKIKRNEWIMKDKMSEWKWWRINGFQLRNSWNIKERRKRKKIKMKSVSKSKI